MALRLISAIFFVLNITFAYSQMYCNFQNFSRVEGLSDNFVFSLSQDSVGYIWMTTSYGINKFDGYTFSSYVKSEQMQQTILRNDFNSVYTDSKNRIWLGSHNGIIMLYNALLDKFDNKSLSFDYPVEYPSISTFYESRGRLYALSTHGVLEYNEREGVFSFLQHNFPELTQIHATALFCDDSDNLWIGTAKHGLFFLSADRKKMQPYPLHDELGNLRITSFCPVDNSTIYVGTARGIYELHTMRYTLKQTALFNDIKQNYITSLELDKNKNMWIGTNYNGLWVYDAHALFYKIEDYQTQGIKIASVNDILCDKENSIWLATQGNGIFLFNPTKNKIQHTSMNIGLAHNVVSAITEDTVGNLWIATDGGGISIISPSYGYIQEMHTPYIPSNSVLGFAKNNASYVWACTWGSGIMKIDMATKEVYSYNLSHTEITNNFVKTICFADSSTLWLGTNGNGVLEFDVQEQNLVKKTSALDTIFKTGRQKYINQIIRDNAGDMWVASLRAVFKITSSEAKCILNFEADKLSFYPGYVYTIAQDYSGNILVGTNRGLYVYSRSGELVQELSTIVQEIKDLEVLSIYAEQYPNYWIATTNGLFVYNAQTQLYETYFVDDFSKGNFYTSRAVYADSHNKIHWGTMNGLYSFYSHSLKKKHSLLALVLSDLYVAYKKVVPNKDWYNKHISQLEKLRLSYKENIWGVTLDAICYNAADATTFAYKLEGFDKYWNHIESKREIVFTNIPPGSYTLKVKAWINNMDDAKIVELPIYISSPWWQTWWFRIVLLLFISALLFALYSYRVYRLKIQKKNLEHEVHKQTQSIATQKKEIELKNEELQQANDTKNYLFSIVAHDLRNSFTSLHGFSELLEDEYDDIQEEDKRNYIGFIRQSSEVVYNLLENLLSWSRSQSRTIVSSPQHCQVQALVQRVIDLYNITANKKSIQVVNKVSEEHTAFVDKEMIVTAIRNIYNNAIKFTPDKGKIIFESRITNTMLELMIIDTGIGIATEDIEGIFEISSSETSLRKKKHGSGLGLIVSKEFVEKNNGTISVKSELKKGSTFIICLPME